MKLLRVIIIGITISITIVGCKKKGCMDPDAINYSTEAQKTDGSCTYYASVYISNIRVEFDSINGNAEPWDLGSWPDTHLWISEKVGVYNFNGWSCSTNSPILDTLVENNSTGLYDIAWNKTYPAHSESFCGLKIVFNEVDTVPEAVGGNIFLYNLDIHEQLSSAPSIVEYSYDNCKLTINLEWIH